MAGIVQMAHHVSEPATYTKDNSYGGTRIQLGEVTKTDRGREGLKGPKALWTQNDY